MPRTKQGIRIIIALAVMALMVAFVLTVGIGALVDDNSTSYTLSEGETDNPKPILNVTLDNVNNSANDISVTVENTNSGTSQSLTNISVGSSQTATLGGDDVTVTADAVNSATEADLTVTYPPDFGYGSGASSIYRILDLLILLVVAFILFEWATQGAISDYMG